MQKWLILLTLLAAGTAGAVPVWKWVDENGVPHYTDHPVPGAQRIELTGVPTVPALKTPETQQAAPAAAPPGGSEAGQAAQTQSGQHVALVKPEPNETLWNIGATLTVQVTVEPPLRPGQHVDVFLDGTRVNVGATATQFTVPNVYRGVHTLQVVVVSPEGQDVARSGSVQFTVQQTSVLNPNNHTPPAVQHRAAPRG